MKTATVRDLRNNFNKLESWLSEGETVEILKQGQPLAILTGHPKLQEESRFAQPDFRSRIREVWGDKEFAQDEVKHMDRLFKDRPGASFPS